MALHSRRQALKVHQGVELSAAGEAQALLDAAHLCRRQQQGGGAGWRAGRRQGFRKARLASDAGVMAAGRGDAGHTGRDDEQHQGAQAAADSPACTRMLAGAAYMCVLHAYVGALAHQGRLPGPPTQCRSAPPCTQHTVPVVTGPTLACQPTHLVGQGCPCPPSCSHCSQRRHQQLKAGGRRRRPGMHHPPDGGVQLLPQ